MSRERVLIVLVIISIAGFVLLKPFSLKPLDVRLISPKDHVRYFAYRKFNKLTAEEKDELNEKLLTHLNDPNAKKRRFAVLVPPECVGIQL